MQLKQPGGHDVHSTFELQARARAHVLCSACAAIGCLRCVGVRFAAQTPRCAMWSTHSAFELQAHTRTPAHVRCVLLALQLDVLRGCSIVRACAAPPHQCSSAWSCTHARMHMCMHAWLALQPPLPGQSAGPCGGVCSAAPRALHGACVRLCTCSRTCTELRKGKPAPYSQHMHSRIKHTLRLNAHPPMRTRAGTASTTSCTRASPASPTPPTSAAAASTRASA